MSISQSTFDFLKHLAENNSKEWFLKHKEAYQQSLEEMKVFHSQVDVLMREHDLIESGRVYRIYRDVRFSKDKTPYKTYWAGGFKRATKALRGGYYFQLAPGNSYIAGGFFGPNSQDLLHIRNQISGDPDPLQDVLKSEPFHSYFGALKGEQLKTSPKGFSVDNSAIELIRHKQFFVEHRFNDSEVLSQGFANVMNNGFINMRPFLDYMSEILSTDLNGELLEV